ncbi:MAG: M28 family metallopeptidase, partial [Bacteroidota bacterium]
MHVLAAHPAAFITTVLLHSVAAGLPDYVVQAAQTTEFSQPRATELLRVLTLDIGPRPMGSPAEQLALEFAVNKLTESGCDTAYIMPMRTTRREFRRIVNTRSGITVGIHKGRTGRIIVLGGHIDSSGPEVPGANDNGSGTAVILELARVLAQREWQSTLVFALFGGEEMGLRGSEHFVTQFATIDSVALMIQVDMANGSPKLLLLADTHDHNAPSWLVRAAFEEFAALGYDGLTYETHFNTFGSLFPRPISSSDHEPFLRKGIPAIGLASDIAAPIHTPQDEFSRFRPEGLKRSGDLVYRLVERFDGGVPEPTKQQYWLYQLGTAFVFVPRWLLWTFVGIAVGTAFASVFILQKRTAADQLKQKIRFSGGKLFVVLLLIVALARGSEFLLVPLKGWRHPWFLEPDLYWLLGVLFGLFGIWIGIHLVRRMKLSRRVNVYLVRSVIPLTLLTVL